MNLLNGYPKVDIMNYTKAKLSTLNLQENMNILPDLLFNN